MVKNVTSLSGNGLRDWLIQRFTAVVMAGYAILLLSFVVRHPQITYSSWYSFFSNTAVRVFSILAIASYVLHAWIGMWTVLTDYIKSTGLRLLCEMLVITTLFAILIWGALIFWGL